jgi:hypothetical protein
MRMLTLTNTQTIALMFLLETTPNRHLMELRRQLALQQKGWVTMGRYKSDVRDYDLLYVTQSELGLCVRKDEDNESFWLPKSKVQFDDRGYRRHEAIQVTIPEWLAVKHELV